MDNLFTYAEESARLRDAGIAQSIESANDKNPGWHDAAISYLRQFVSESGMTTFMAENIRMYSHLKGLPKPDSLRAWGAVMISARKQGIIRMVGTGTVTNPRAHRAFASVYMKGENA